MTEWWFLECEDGGLLRMPFSPRRPWSSAASTLGGADAAVGEPLPLPRRPERRQGRVPDDDDGDERLGGVLDAPVHRADARRVLPVVGPGGGQGRQAEAAQGTSAINGYCYRVGVASAIALPPGSRPLRLVKRPSDAATIPPTTEAAYVLRRSATMVFSGDAGPRARGDDGRPSPSTTADRPREAKRCRVEAATTTPATTTKAGRHSRVARRFFFPLEVAKFSFRVETGTESGWNAHPVALAPVRGDWGRAVDLLRPGDSRRVARLTDNSISAARMRYQHRGWFGSFRGDGCRSVAGPGQVGIALRSLLACATSKIQFVQLHATISDALPKVWGPDVHGLFPFKFRHVAQTLLLARARHRNAWKAWRSGDRAGPPPACKGLAALVDRDLFGVLRFLSHDPALVNTAGHPLGRAAAKPTEYTTRPDNPLELMEVEPEIEEDLPEDDAPFQRLEITLNVNDRFSSPRSSDARRMAQARRPRDRGRPPQVRGAPRAPRGPRCGAEPPRRPPEKAFAMDALLGAAVVTTSPEAAQPAGVRTPLKSYQKRALLDALPRARRRRRQQAAERGASTRRGARSAPQRPPGLPEPPQRGRLDLRPSRPPETTKGGLLCEQMGLGKPIEIISLIRAPGPDAMDEDASKQRRRRTHRRPRSRRPDAAQAVAVRQGPNKGLAAEGGGAPAFKPIAAMARPRSRRPCWASTCGRPGLGKGRDDPEPRRQGARVPLEEALQDDRRRGAAAPRPVGGAARGALRRLCPQILKLPHWPRAAEEEAREAGLPQARERLQALPGGLQLARRAPLAVGGGVKKRSKENQKRLDAHKNSWTGSVSRTRPTRRPCGPARPSAATSTS